MPKIGHVHLKVSDLRKAEEFYTNVFRLKVAERVANYLFLTFGKEHHDLALQEHRNARHPTEGMTGLYHFAVELKNLKELAKIYFKLKKLKIQFTPIDHGISKTIYLSDPDENGIEVYVDTRKERKNWHGMSAFIEEEEFQKWLE
ncbi:VOC family protein [Candidatus Woesearchaeota archaeon]|nr:VOC family protein [Candidatus Woesearchaeota archaeon]